MIGEGASVVRAVSALVERMRERRVESELTDRLVSIGSEALRVEMALAEKQSEIDRLTSRLNAIPTLSDAEKSEHTLVSVSPYVDTSAYAYCKDGDTNNPWLCCQCFDVGRRSLLQAAESRTGVNPRRGRVVVHRCNVCGTEVAP